MRFVYLWKRSKNFKGVLQEKHFKWKYFRGWNFHEQVVYSHDRRSAFVYIHPRKDYIVTWQISAPLPHKSIRMGTGCLVQFLTLCEDWTGPRERRTKIYDNVYIFAPFSNSLWLKKVMCFGRWYVRQLFDQEGVILTLQANWFSYLQSYSPLRVLSTVMHTSLVENTLTKSNTFDCRKYSE